MVERTVCVKIVTFVTLVCAVAILVAIKTPKKTEIIKKNFFIKNDLFLDCLLLCSLSLDRYAGIVTHFHDYIQSCSVDNPRWYTIWEQSSCEDNPRSGAMFS